MALISCPECDAKVSDTALKCTQYGVQLRKAKRTFMGKVFKWAFILFNVLMAWWLVAGMNAASKVIDAGGSEAAQAGAAIGTGLGAMMVLIIWFIGAVVLGMFVLFTRPKT
jgi:hypothetical protein